MNQADIVSRVIVGAQQDLNGNKWNVLACYDRYGNKEYQNEAIVEADEKEVAFSLISAKGHLWYLTSKTMRARPCSNYEDCAICQVYNKAQPTPSTSLNS